MHIVEKKDKISAYVIRSDGGIFCSDIQHGTDKRSLIRKVTDLWKGITIPYRVKTLLIVATVIMSIICVSCMSVSIYYQITNHASQMSDHFVQNDNIFNENYNNIQYNDHNNDPIIDYSQNDFSYDDFPIM